MTALICAASAGHVSCLELLIRHGAVVEANGEVTNSATNVIYRIIMCEMEHHIRNISLGWGDSGDVGSYARSFRVPADLNPQWRQRKSPHPCECVL